MNQFLVWVSDFAYAKSVFEKHFKQNILAETKNLGVFAMNLNKTQVEQILRFWFVKSVLPSQKSDVLLKKSRKFLKIDHLHKKGFLGQGVCVAVIDTGCHPHLDFVLGKNRILCFKDFLQNKTTPYDDNGHGTFVAGVLGGNGISKGGKFKGIAPACDFVILKTLDKNGETLAHNILIAMQWVLENAKKFNIKIVCMSFGSDVQGHNDPLIKGAESLWQNGLVVVCAAGNDGPAPNSIKSPGASPSVITVGSTGRLQKNKSPEPADFSSRGPAFNFFKPDVLAPGVEIVSTTNSSKFYTQMSGTSVSTPFVAGLCALVLSKYDLSPNELKFFLQKSATKTNFSQNQSGSGLINPLSLFELLKNWF